MKTIRKKIYAITIGYKKYRKDNNVTITIFDNVEEYKKTTKNWINQDIKTNKKHVVIYRNDMLLP